MDIRFINGIEVTITGEIIDEELTIYLSQLQAKQKYKLIKADVIVNGEYLDIDYTFESVPFERIRRITGYLVGSIDRWGDGKRAEEKDRVKHG